MRLFTAIEIPVKIKSELKSYLAIEKEKLEKQTQGKINWTKSDNWHITLKFFGDVNLKNYQKLHELLVNFYLNYQPFELEFSHITIWPKQKPKIIIIKISDNKKLNLLIKKLAKIVDNSKLIKPNLTGFKPAHMTLARIKGNWLGENYLYDFKKTYSVKQIKLFQSELTPQGPIYTELETYYLKR